MSNEAYGYLEFSNYRPHEKLIESFQRATGLGLTSIPVSELHNFPENLLPKNQNHAFCFIIGDRPGSLNATYLMDYLDYAPEAKIDLPKQGRERVNLLVKALTFLTEEAKPEGFLIALTDSSQIEEIKTVDISELFEIITGDFEEDSGPPNCLYHVIEKE